MVIGIPSGLTWPSFNDQVDREEDKSFNSQGDKVPSEHLEWEWIFILVNIKALVDISDQLIGGEADESVP